LRKKAKGVFMMETPFGDEVQTHNFRGEIQFSKLRTTLPYHGHVSFIPLLSFFKRE
jgi:hypothetical protein